MIEFKNVTKVYDGWSTALSDLNLQIADGEFVFIVGPSESGKSTLFRLLTCMDKPTSGSITVNDWDLCNMKRKKIPYYRRKLGIIFQDFRLFPKKSVFENVALALHIVGEHSSGVRMKSAAALKMVELSDAGKKRPAQLSPVDQQRVALARALAGGPGIIIADEPTGNLDPVQGKEFVELLLRIHNRYQKTVLVFTNNKEFAEEFGQRIIVLSHGVIEEDRAAVLPPDVIMEEELREDEKKDGEPSEIRTGADDSTQVFDTGAIAGGFSVPPVSAEHTTQFDAIDPASAEHTTQFDAIDPAAAEHTTQFDAIDPAAAEHTTQFDAIDPAAAEHTTQFDAIDPAVPTVDEKDAAPDLPTLPAEKPELPIAPPPLPPVLPTEVRGEKSAEEEITSESGDLETIEEPDELSDAKTEEKAVLPSEDAVVLPVAEETVEASPPSLSDEPGELTEQTTTFDVTRVTDADLVSAVMRLISDAGNPPSDEVRESSNRRHLEDVTVIDDWHTPEKKQEDGRSAEEGEA